jgi:hypothetical protein
VVAIVAGIGLITAVIAGVQVSSVVPILIPLVVIGWSVYHYVVVRPASAPPSRRQSATISWRVKPPDASDDHEGL